MAMANQLLFFFESAAGFVFNEQEGIPFLDNK
jgi:hypothetical protein